MIIISPCIVGYLIRSNNTFVLRKLEFLFTCCMYLRYQIAKVVCLKILLFFAHMGWSIKSLPRCSYQYSPLQVLLDVIGLLQILLIQNLQNLLNIIRMLFWNVICYNTKIYVIFEIKFNQLIVESQIPGFNPRNVFYDVVSNNLNSTCKHCMGYYITHT